MIAIETDAVARLPGGPIAYTLRRSPRSRGLRVVIHPDRGMVVTVPLVTYGVTRYMLLVMVEGHGEAPEKLLVSDRLLVGTAALWLALCVAILYTKINIFAG